METQEAILSRRSIRKFQKKEVPEEAIMKLLEAGMYAPTARNTQAWQFVVINHRHLLDSLAVIHPYAKMLRYASVAILVCGDKITEENEAYLNQNCAAATQNILLCAHDLGLGGVWLGVYPKADRMEPIAGLLKLPSHIMPVSLIGIGWPDETKEKPERFSMEKIHYNDVWYP